MSEAFVRWSLKVILSSLWIGAILNVAMEVFPRADAFTPGQAGCILASLILWWITGIRAVLWAVGSCDAVSSPSGSDK